MFESHWKMLLVAMYFAWTETQARYRRSILGPFWITLGTLTASLGLALIWASILDVDFKTFIPFVTLGIILWQLISGVMLEAAGNFYRNTAMFQERAISPYFFTYQLVLKGLITLAHSLPPVIIIVLILNPGVYGTEHWGLFGLILLFGHLFWVAHMLSYIGTRYRDIEPLLSNIMPILFFCTPVIYEVRKLKSLDFIAHLNPFFYAIEIVRGPLLGAPPGLIVYLFVFVTLVVGLMVSYVITQRFNRRLVQWL